MRAGAKLYSRENLHAKVMLLDDWPVVGSANASNASVNTYVEAILITDRVDVAGQVEQLIDSLARSSTPIDGRYLRRILALPVVRRPPTGRSARKVLPPDLTVPQTRLISVREDLEYTGDADLINDFSEQEQARVGRKAGEMDWFFARPADYSDVRIGDIFIECCRRTNEVASTRSVRIYPPGRLTKTYSSPITFAATRG